MIHSNNIFINVPGFNNRVMPQGIEDTRTEKPGIRAYCWLIGKILAIFNFAVKLEAKNENGKLCIRYVNIESAKEWKARQEEAHHLNHTPSFFQTPETLDTFIQLVRADIHQKKSTKESNHPENNSNENQSKTFPEQSTNTKDTNNANQITSTKIKELGSTQTNIPTTPQKSATSNMSEFPSVKNDQNTDKTSPQKTPLPDPQKESATSNKSPEFPSVKNDQATDKTNPQKTPLPDTQKQSDTPKGSEATATNGSKAPKETPAIVAEKITTQVTEGNKEAPAPTMASDRYSNDLAAVKAKILELKKFILSQSLHVDIKWYKDRFNFKLKNYPQFLLSLYISEESEEDKQQILPLRNICEEKNLYLLEFAHHDQVEIEKLRNIYISYLPSVPENQDQLWEQKKDKMITTFKQLTKLVLSIKYRFSLRGVVNILDEEMHGHQKIIFYPHSVWGFFHDGTFQTLLFNDEDFPQGLLTVCKTKEQIAAVLDEASLTHAEDVNMLIENIYYKHINDSLPSSKSAARNKREAVIETILYQSKLCKKYISENIHHDKFKPINVDFDTFDIDPHEEGVTDFNKEALKNAIATIVGVLNQALNDKENEENVSGDDTPSEQKARNLLLSARFSPSILSIVNQDYDPSSSVVKGEWVRRILKVLQRGGYVVDFVRNERDGEPYWIVQV